MTPQELISSGLLESYVLGTTTDEENKLVQDLCKKHPGLLAEIESIEQELMQLSSFAGHPPASPGLKEKIAAQLTFSDEPAKVIPLTTTAAPTTTTRFYKFALAASLLLFVTSFAYNVLLQKQLDRANGELAQLSTDKSYMAQEMQVQQAAMTTMNTQFRIVANPKVKTVALSGMNYLAKSSATIHWNTETDEVYFDALQLPASPSDRQYQLWAIVDGKPVDAGMIDPTDKTIFQKMKAVKGAQAFAVTIEKAGGSASPTLETMCLLGNV